MPAEITIGDAGETIVVGASGETIVLNAPAVVTLPVAAGADGQVQFNDAGALAGATGLEWDKATEELLLNGGLVFKSPADGELDLTNAAGTEGALVRLDNILFDLVTAAATAEEGLLQWDAENKTLSLGMPGGAVNLQIGQEFLARVKNTSAGVLADGTAIHVTGSTGNFANVEPADNSAVATSQIGGVTTEEIAVNDFGFVTTAGLVNGIDTSAFAAGAVVWLGSAGAFTATRPAAPLFSIVVGVVIRSHATLGSLYVRPVYIPRLTHLSDVNVRDTALVDGDLLSWDFGNLRWDRVTRASLIGGGTGAAGLVAYFTGPGAIAGDVGLSFDQATGLLQFGGVTSASPAWRKEGDDFGARVADNSGYTSVIAKSFTATNSVIVGGANFVSFQARSRLAASADGNLTLTNWALDDFNLIQLGGITAAFGAIGRNGAGVAIRVANDTGYGTLDSGLLTMHGNIEMGANLLKFGGGTTYVKSSGTNFQVYVNGGLDISANGLRTDFYRPVNIIGNYIYSIGAATRMGGAASAVGMSDAGGNFIFANETNFHGVAWFDDEVRGPKCMLTPEGGYAVRLTNKTGAASVKGTCVETHATVDDAFDISAADALDPCGFVYEDGIADGAECWVVISGIAEALIEDGTTATRHYWAGTSSTAGRINVNTATPPGAVVGHFQEVGHGLQSIASGTDVLARIIIHFN